SSSKTPVSAAHAIAAPALTAPMRSGWRFRRLAAVDQKPSCQKHRHPPPAKTTASKWLADIPERNRKLVLQKMEPKFSARRPRGKRGPTPRNSCGTSKQPLRKRVGLAGCARLAEDQLGGCPAPAGDDRLLPVAARQRDRLVARDP